jgi:hypothetical protein
MASSHHNRLYGVPKCIKSQCAQKPCSRWLHRKAVAHVCRDRKRFGIESCTVAAYKAAIHRAVEQGGDRDFYSGEVLDWRLISTYRNAASIEGKSKYKKSLALLPTVDHTLDEHDKPKFVICSWRMNDMKNDLTDAELYELCERVLRHRGNGRGRNVGA